MYINVQTHKMDGENSSWIPLEILFHLLLYARVSLSHCARPFVERKTSGNNSTIFNSKILAGGCESGGRVARSGYATSLHHAGDTNFRPPLTLYAPGTQIDFGSRFIVAQNWEILEVEQEMGYLSTGQLDDKMAKQNQSIATDWPPRIGRKEIQL